MYLFDRCNLVYVRMVVWQGGRFSPDLSLDFFDAGGLDYDEDMGAYVVDSVDYCLEQAREWCLQSDDYEVFIREVF